MKGYQDELDEKIQKAAFQMKRSEPVSCPDEETLVCYLENRLEEEERDEVESHIAVCSSCCDHVIAMNRVIHAEEEATPVSEKLIRGAIDLDKERPLRTLMIPEHKREQVAASSGSILLTSIASHQLLIYVPIIIAFSLILIASCIVLIGSIFETGKSTSPLEMGMNITAKMSRIAKRGIAAGPSVVAIKEGDSLHSHDQFQIHLKTNRDAHIYVVLHSSRGQSQLLFPSSENRISNKIEGGRSYTLPAKNLWFFLDENTGIETVFVLVSKNPVDDIESHIESLKKEDIHKVKEMLNKKADLIKVMSFQHVDDKGM